MKSKAVWFAFGFLLSAAVFFLADVASFVLHSNTNPSPLVAAFEGGRIVQGDPVWKCIDLAKPVAIVEFDNPGASDRALVFAHPDNHLYVYVKDDTVVCAQHIDLRGRVRGRWYLRSAP